MTMANAPEITIGQKSQLMKTLAGLLLMLVFFLHGGQAKGVETHYIDKFIDSGASIGNPDYIQFGAVRINLQHGSIPDDNRVEIDENFNPDEFDLNHYSTFFETQRVIDLFYEVTTLAADTGTALTATGGRNSALAMLSVINRLFMENRDTAINRLHSFHDSGEQPYAESMFNYLVENSETQEEVFTIAFYGFWLRQNNAVNLPADRTNLTASFGELIQNGISDRAGNTEQASQQNRSVNINHHFGMLHSDEGIVGSLQEQNVATTFALAVGLNALLESSPSQQSEDRTIEQILSRSPVLPLAQQTLIASMGRRRPAPHTTTSDTPSESTLPNDTSSPLSNNNHQPALPLSMYGFLFPDNFPSTLGSLYRNYRQSKKHKTPASRIPFPFFLAIGASSAQNSASSQTLNQLVTNGVFGTDLYGATCDSTSSPTSESGSVITSEELDTVSSNLTRYLKTDTIIPKQIPGIVHAVLVELQSVNRLEPDSFIRSKRGKACANLAISIGRGASNDNQPLSAETLLLRGLFRGYFETFSTALQRLADGDRESPEVRALIVLLNIIIETETGYSAPPSPADQLNKRQPPSGGAGASLAAP
ncbi:hypothetical protein [Endozoicomonas euniceicola]|uniref:Uncharacterized protein n=1 Tax=Endozoicomonas euniceicola TaxID=1234143 RepID=A0ABY6GUL6_9GAMM|nr:hypothetical protein [Endozoicomonas euniceicola]UYM15751.1 hypothetical protein NX720_23470 [Endozoicomonas euniceicola]